MSNGVVILVSNLFYFVVRNILQVFDVWWVVICFYMDIGCIDMVGNVYVRVVGFG